MNTNLYSECGLSQAGNKILEKQPKNQETIYSQFNFNELDEQEGNFNDTDFPTIFPSNNLTNFARQRSLRVSFAQSDIKAYKTLLKDNDETPILNSRLGPNNCTTKTPKPFTPKYNDANLTSNNLTNPMVSSPQPGLRINHQFTSGEEVKLSEDMAMEHYNGMASQTTPFGQGIQNVTATHLWYNPQYQLKNPLPLTGNSVNTHPYWMHPMHSQDGALKGMTRETHHALIPEESSRIFDQKQKTSDCSQAQPKILASPASKAILKKKDRDQKRKPKTP